MTPAILLPSPRRTFTTDERKSIAAGWRSSTLNQTEYAAQHGIQPRTLRLWLRDQTPAEATPETIRKTGLRMLAALRHAAALLEEALDQIGDTSRHAVGSHVQEAPAVENSAPKLSVKRITFD